MSNQENGPARYDSALQMFIEPEQEPDENRLRFVKWLKEHDRLETPAAKEAESPEQQITLPTATAKPSKAIGLKAAPYDAGLQMFVDAAHEPAKETLLFLRWMAEQGRLEHHVAGPVSGPAAQEREAEPAA